MCDFRIFCEGCEEQSEGQSEGLTPCFCGNVKGVKGNPSHVCAHMGGRGCAPAPAHVRGRTPSHPSHPSLDSKIKRLGSEGRTDQGFTPFTWLSLALEAQR